ncbi:MAG: hypothetical protein NC094_07570 [Bacteroidales bacterium]|nr:hypothetical protein [Lachnoclostridium sp.]MCM1384728.1 hypothetical protein [Lachnoclostridium sp.]MCM1465258.1 hypothetical protein [Bacteroidales bacterium]
MKETEINVMDLLVEILLHWRVIVVWMLVGGILMGTFSYVNSYRTAEAQKSRKAVLEQELKEQEIRMEEDWRKEITEQEKNNVSIVLNYEKYIAEMQMYLDNSVLMQIDAQKVPRIEMTFWVKASDEEESTSIAKVYEDSIATGFLQWLAEGGQGGVDDVMVSELVSVNRSSRGLYRGDDSFCVNIMHVDEEHCAQLSEQLIAYMNAQQKNLQELMGTHTIEVANQSFAYVANNNLGQTQKNMRSEITNHIGSVVQYKTQFSEEAWRYYNFLTTGIASGIPDEYKQDTKKEDTNKTDMETDLKRDPEEELKALVITSPAVSIKYIIVGMLLFAIIVVFYGVIKYVLNSRLRASDDMNEKFGISQLALISADQNTKKLFSFVDNQILKLRNYNKRVFSESEATGFAAVAVKLAVKKENVNEVFCIGCDMKGRTQRIAGQLQDILRKDNITLNILNNILYDQEVLKQLSEAKCVFLLETAGSTLYDEIARELELLNRQEIKVIGGIVVE